MAIIRRHWKLALLNMLVLVLGISALIWYTLPPGQPAAKVQADVVGTGQAAPTPLDVVTYSRIQQLRQSMCLTTIDLEAMNCTQAQATTIFTNLKSWYQSNSTAWTAAEQQETEAAANLQDAFQKINVGPKDQSVLAQIPALQSSVAAAQSNFAQLLQSGANSVSSVLSDQQQQVWSIAKANVAANVPDQYRFVPNITAAQLQALKLASASHGTIDYASTLAVSQQQAMIPAGATQSQIGTGILAADAAILPPPLLYANAASSSQSPQ